MWAASSIANVSNKLGPSWCPEKLIPLVTLNALEGETLPIYVDGPHTHDWPFVDDYGRAFRPVFEIEKAGEIEDY